MSIDGRNAPPRPLSECDVTRFVGAYMKWPGLSERDDPVDHFMRLLQMAYSLPGANPPGPVRKPRADTAGRREDFVAWAATVLVAANPCFTCESWKRLVSGVLGEFFAGQKPYIKRKPTQAKLADVRILTAKQLMEKHGISRSRAYQLLAGRRTRK